MICLVLFVYIHTILPHGSTVYLYNKPMQSSIKSVLPLVFQLDVLTESGVPNTRVQCTRSSSCPNRKSQLTHILQSTHISIRSWTWGSRIYKTDIVPGDYHIHHKEGSCSTRTCVCETQYAPTVQVTLMFDIQHLVWPGTWYTVPKL